jgi:hypothetical protein
LYQRGGRIEVSRNVGGHEANEKKNYPCALSVIVSPTSDNFYMNKVEPKFIGS